MWRWENKEVFKTSSHLHKEHSKARLLFTVRMVRMMPLRANGFSSPYMQRYEELLEGLKIRKKAKQNIHTSVGNQRESKKTGTHRPTHTNAVQSKKKND